MTTLKIDADFQNKLTESIIRLLDYCQTNNWAGYDPFDGLNSRIFKRLPFLQNRICRLIFIQSMKRSPVNFRHIFLVPKTQNPKAIALFLMAFLKLKKLGLLQDENLITLMTQKLIDLRSPTNSNNSSNSTNPINSSNPYWCWGYNFDWQSRGFFLPKFSPNIICTTFAGNALIDAYHKFADEKYLDMAISAGNFLLKGLNISKNKNELCFSYTTLDSSKVHNANLLGAAFLSRLYSITQEKKFLEPASSAVQFSIRRQHEDGSWPYGEDKTQQWIDNFHTGYNLCALKKISHYLDTKEYESNIRRGFEFYRNHFFREDAAPKYFNNRTYPVDIHSVAQSIITLSTFRDLDENNIKLARSVYEWAMANMLDEQGYFYYQVTPYYKNKISYMRWSQAWMLYALAIFAQALSTEASSHPDNVAL